MARTKLYQSSDELLDYYGLSSYSRDKQGNRIKIDKKETRVVYLRGKAQKSGNVSLIFYSCANGKAERQNSGYVEKPQSFDPRGQSFVDPLRPFIFAPL